MIKGVILDKHLHLEKGCRTRCGLGTPLKTKYG